MTVLEKLKMRFSIRTLLLGVLFISLPLALWVRSTRLRELAAEHHLKAMENGYQAAKIHCPEPRPWDWKFLSLPLTDPDTLAQAVPRWRALMQHEEMRDIYLNALRKPWMPLPSKRLNQIYAQQSANLESNPSALWKDVIKPYIDEKRYMKKYSPVQFYPGEKNHALSERLLDNLSDQFRASGIEIIESDIITFDESGNLLDPHRAKGLETIDVDWKIAR